MPEDLKPELINAIWQQALTTLRMRLGAKTAASWFENLQPYALQENRFQLAVSDRASRDWLNARYAGDLREALALALGRPVGIELVVRRLDSPQQRSEPQQCGENVQQPATPDQLWPRVITRLRAEFGDAAYTRWFQRLTCLHDDETGLKIVTDKSSAARWIEAQYGDRLRSLLTEICGRPIMVKIETKSVSPTASASPTATKFQAPWWNEGDSDDIGDRLDPNYIFDRFIIGPANRFAYEASLQAATTQENDLNPLYIHGWVGLGKTHLLQAIAHHARMRDASQRIIYLRSQRFLEIFLNALRGKTLLDFKTRFRSADILLIDDIQALGGKEVTQEEFLQGFNTLIEARRRIVITADAPPDTIQGFDARIQSRFSGGLVIEVEKPDSDLRSAILDAKAQERGITLSRDVVDILTQGMSTNIRELEGALNHLLGRARLMNEPITAQSARRLVAERSAQGSGPINIESIQHHVAEHFRIPRRELNSPCRARALVRPRHMAMFLSKKLTDSSLPEIGRQFGKRDYSTVLHAVRKIEAALERGDSTVSEDIHALQRRIGG